MNLPSHDLRFERGLTMTCVDLIVDGRKVAQTTFGNPVDRDSEAVRDFVRAYFHIPKPRPADD